MAVIHEDHGVVFVGEFADRIERGQVAVHAEDAVGDDHADAPVLMLLQLPLQVLHVAMLVGVALGLAQPDTVNN